VVERRDNFLGNRLGLFHCLLLFCSSRSNSFVFPIKIIRHELAGLFWLWCVILLHSTKSYIFISCHLECCLPSNVIRLLIEDSFILQLPVLVRLQSETIHFLAQRSHLHAFQSSWVCLSKSIIKRLGIALVASSRGKIRLRIWKGQIFVRWVQASSLTRAVFRSSVE
jgi:hypothetical protein